MKRGALLLAVLSFAAAAAAPAAHATFPGRNGDLTYVYYDSDDGTGQYLQTLITVSSTGRQLRTRTICSGTTCFDGGSRPSFSADGRRLAYHVPQGIAIRTLRTGKVTTTKRLGFGMFDPGFSPDGKRIVVTVKRTADPPESQTGPTEPAPTDVFVVTPKTGEARLLARDADQPDWGSRDRITYRSGGDLYTVSPSGAGARRIATKAQDPSWAPSGKTVVYARAGTAYATRADGAKTRRLTRRSCSAPVMSPDGKRVLCDDGTLGMYRLKPWKLLHEIDSDQSGDTYGTSHSAAAWRPVRR